MNTLSTAINIVLYVSSWRQPTLAMASNNSQEIVVVFVKYRDIPATAQPRIVAIRFNFDEA